MRDSLSKNKMERDWGRQPALTPAHMCALSGTLYTQRDKRNADGKWEEETREDQEEKRKSKEFKLELKCKRDLHRVCLSNSLYLRGYKVKDFFKNIKPTTGLSIFWSFPFTYLRVIFKNSWFHYWNMFLFCHLCASIWSSWTHKNVSDSWSKLWSFL